MLDPPLSRDTTHRVVAYHIRPLCAGEGGEKPLGYLPTIGSGRRKFLSIEISRERRHQHRTFCPFQSHCKYGWLQVIYRGVPGLEVAD